TRARRPIRQPGRASPGRQCTWRVTRTMPAASRSMRISIRWPRKVRLRNVSDFQVAGRTGAYASMSPLLANAQTAESVDQALQVSRRARKEVSGVVAGRFGAHVERRLERAAGEIGSEPGRGIGAATDRVGGDRPLCNAHAGRSDRRDGRRANGVV